MAVQRHVVKRHVLEVGMPAGQDLAAFQEVLRRAFYGRMIEAIDRCCNALCAADEVHRIERIEVDLGELPVEGLDEALAEAFETALHGALTRAIRAQQSEAGGGRAAKTAARLELLGHFVETGSLPWWADASAPELLDETVAWLVTEAPAALEALVVDLVAHEPARRRLVRQLSDASLLALARPFAGDARPFVARLYEDLRAALPRVAGLALPAHRHRALLWEAILLAVVAPPGRHGGPEDGRAALPVRSSPAPGESPAFVPAEGTAGGGRFGRSERGGAQATAARAGILQAVLLQIAVRSRLRYVALLEALARVLSPPPAGPAATAGSTSALLAALLAELRSDVRPGPRPDPQTGPPDEQRSLRPVQPHPAPAAPRPPASSHDTTAAQVARIDPVPPSREATARGAPTEPSDAEQREQGGASAAALIPAAAPFEGSPDAPLESLVGGPAEATGTAREGESRGEGGEEAARQAAAARLRAYAFGAADEWYVENAGLVVLWPFLARFFEHMELLDERQFRDATAVHRAAGLLQHLADGQPEAPPEYLLPLNKVLCGIDPGAVFDPGEPFTGEEIEACDVLLRAVVAHVPLLGEMSVRGFRGTFLLRKGQLGTRDGAWLLRVERESYDVVLDRFPWSPRLVKLPWMPAPLYVEW